MFFYHKHVGPVGSRAIITSLELRTNQIIANILLICPNLDDSLTFLANSFYGIFATPIFDYVYVCVIGHVVLRVAYISWTCPHNQPNNSARSTIIIHT